MTTKIHMVAADAKTAVTFSLSPGQAGDPPEGRKLLKTLPVVPPKCNRVNARERSTELYKKRNEVGRLFRRLKGFRRIFSRFDKLDCVFMFFIHFALIADIIVSVNTP